MAGCHVRVLAVPEVQGFKRRSDGASKWSGADMTVTLAVTEQDGTTPYRPNDGEPVALIAWLLAPGASRWAEPRPLSPAAGSTTDGMCWTATDAAAGRRTLVFRIPAQSLVGPRLVVRAAVLQPAPAAWPAAAAVFPAPPGLQATAAPGQGPPPVPLRVDDAALDVIMLGGLRDLVLESAPRAANELIRSVPKRPAPRPKQRILFIQASASDAGIEGEANEKTLSKMVQRKLVIPWYRQMVEKNTSPTNRGLHHTSPLPVKLRFGYLSSAGHGDQRSDRAWQIIDVSAVMQMDQPAQEARFREIQTICVDSIWRSPARNWPQVMLTVRKDGGNMPHTLTKLMWQSGWRVANGGADIPNPALRRYQFINRSEPPDYAQAVVSHFQGDLWPEGEDSSWTAAQPYSGEDDAKANETRPKEAVEGQGGLPWEERKTHLWDITVPVLRRPERSGGRRVKPGRAAPPRRENGPLEITAEMLEWLDQESGGAEAQEEHKDLGQGKVHAEDDDVEENEGRLDVVQIELPIEPLKGARLFTWLYKPPLACFGFFHVDEAHDPQIAARLPQCACRRNRNASGEQDDGDDDAASPRKRLRLENPEDTTES